jgi:hypothetical protein
VRGASVGEDSDARGEPGAEDVDDVVAVDEAVVGLVEVGEQTVVTSRDALLAGAGGLAEVGEGVGVEVTEFEGPPGDAREGGRLVDQAAENAGAALGGLVEEDATPVRARRQRLRGELAVLELELELDRRLDGGLQRRHGLFVEREGEVEDQAVAGVADVGDDAGLTRGRRLVWIGIGVLGVLAADPGAGLGVEQEARDLVRLAAAPAEVDPPDVSGVAIGQGGEQLVTGSEELGDGLSRSAVDPGEMDVGPQVVADPQALLFVGRDPIAAVRGHVAHAEQVGVDARDATPTVGAEVGGGGVLQGLDVSAELAAEHPGQQSAVLRGLGVGAEDDLADHVARALVIDDRLRAELGDGEEARARQELVVVLQSTPRARQVRGEWQAREVVAG